VRQAKIRILEIAILAVSVPLGIGLCLVPVGLYVLDVCTGDWSGSILPAAVYVCSVLGWYVALFASDHVMVMECFGQADSGCNDQ
jgi:hypothetical protein